MMLIYRHVLEYNNTRMGLYTTHKETKFGVGDTVRISQQISEGDKTRIQVFEGMVIGIRGRGNEKTFTVRRMGSAQVGIEKIYPLYSPIVKEIEVVKKGLRGVRQSKLFYTREKSAKEISKIYSRSSRREEAKLNKKTEKKAKTKPVKKAKKADASKKK